MRRLFATIADRYDFITVVLSYGQDRRWKRRLIDLANRGGGPELNSFEVFASGENREIEFPANPLTKAEITTSTDEIVFSRTQRGHTKQLILESRDGNQASLISYVQLDNTAGFTVQLPVRTPFTLAPGGQVPVGHSWPRSNAEGRESTGAAMLTGKIPYWGLHLEENRRGTHLVEVEIPVEDVADWGLLGYYIGEVVQEKGSARAAPRLRTPAGSPAIPRRQSVISTCSSRWADR